MLWVELRRMNGLQSVAMEILIWLPIEQDTEDRGELIEKQSYEATEEDPILSTGDLADDF
ncbi:hypothetical protein KIN20_034923 [Parelaphostrongylus tenuis]|uniref:Uncharacterized protein n=1 Tax=Parelaphostrongylus tenuis TaxID=148309 RepID=A0AAD5RB21_PARTN|nr:hypothetical protein KIN20_034923 [Parelaphostrongylus tenuis]